MKATLDAGPLDEATRAALRQFFSHTPAYITGEPAGTLGSLGSQAPGELATRWAEQRVLDRLIAAIAATNDEEAFAARPSVCVGILARMIQSGRPALIRFACDAIERDGSLANTRSGGQDHPPLSIRRWLFRNGGAPAASWHRPQHQRSRTTPTPLLFGKRMRLAPRARPGPHACASRRKRQR